MNPLNYKLLLHRIREGGVDYAEAMDFSAERSQTPLIEREMEMLRDGIFAIGSYAEGAKNDSRHCLEPLPYEPLWIEWAIRTEDMGVVAKAVLVGSVISTAGPLGDHLPDQCYPFWVFCLSRQHHRPIFQSCGMVEATPEGFVNTARSFYENIAASCSSKFLAEEGRARAAEGLQAITQLLFILGVRNIEISERLSYPRIVRKISAEDRARRIICKTLVLHHQAKRLRHKVFDTGESIERGLCMRAHFARGNWAEYGSENKLFGKFANVRVWRPSHMKGNLKRGLVEKDYVLEKQQQGRRGL